MSETESEENVQTSKLDGAAIGDSTTSSPSRSASFSTRASVKKTASGVFKALERRLSRIVSLSSEPQSPTENGVKSILKKSERKPKTKRRVAMLDAVEVIHTSTENEGKKASTPIFHINFWRNNKLAHYAILLMFSCIIIAESVILGVQWNYVCNKPLQYIYIGNIATTAAMLVIFAVFVILRHLQERKRLSEIEKLKSKKETVRVSRKPIFVSQFPNDLLQSSSPAGDEVINTLQKLQNGKSASLVSSPPPPPIPECMEAATEPSSTFSMIQLTPESLQDKMEWDEEEMKDSHQIIPAFSRINDTAMTRNASFQELLQGATALNPKNFVIPLLEDEKEEANMEKPEAEAVVKIDVGSIELQLIADENNSQEKPTAEPAAPARTASVQFDTNEAVITISPRGYTPTSAKPADYLEPVKFEHKKVVTPADRARLLFNLVWGFVWAVVHLWVVGSAIFVFDVGTCYNNNSVLYIANVVHFAFLVILIVLQLFLLVMSSSRGRRR